MNRLTPKKQNGFISCDKENLGSLNDAAQVKQAHGIDGKHKTAARETHEPASLPSAKSSAGHKAQPALEILYIDFIRIPTGLLYTNNFEPTCFLLKVLPESESHRAIVNSTDENDTMHLSLIHSNRLTILRQENINTFGLVDLVLVVHGVILTRYAQDEEVIEVEGMLTGGNANAVLEAVCESFDPDINPGGTTTQVLRAPLNYDRIMCIRGKIWIRIDRHKMLMMLAEYIIQRSLVRRQELAISGGGYTRTAEGCARDKIFKLICDYCMSRSRAGNVANDFEDAKREDLMQAVLSATTTPGAFWYRLVEVRQV